MDASMSPANSNPQGSETQADHPSRSIPRTGNLFKLADGFVSKGWNARYFVLRGSTLQYFGGARDPSPKEVIDILHADVSWLGEFMDQANCFVVEPLSHRSVHLASNSLDEAKQWMRWLQEAADPQAYMDVPSPQTFRDLQPNRSVETPPIRKPEVKLSPVEIPKDIPLKFSDSVKLVEQTVAQLEAGIVPDGLVLADVTMGVRTYSTENTVPSPVYPQMGSGSLALQLFFGGFLTVTALLLRDSTITLLVTILAILYGYRSNRETLRAMRRRLRRGQDKHTRSGGNLFEKVHVGVCYVEAVVPEGVLNWLLDAGRMKLWVPGLECGYRQGDTSGSSSDLLGLEFFDNTECGHSFNRWWTTSGSDKTVIMLTVEDDTHVNWVVRPSAEGCHVYLIAGDRGFSSNRISVFAKSLVGLSETMKSFGNHDGSGMAAKDMLRDRGALLFLGGAEKSETKNLWVNLLTSSDTVRVSHTLSDVFPVASSSSLRTPLESISALFGSVGSVLENESPVRSVFLGLLNALPDTAHQLASCTAWTTQIVAAPSTEVYYLHGAMGSYQILWEVSESSKTRASGLWLHAKVAVSGAAGWTVTGSVKYLVYLEDRSRIEVNFSECNFEYSDKKSVVQFTIPSLCVERPDSRENASRFRVFWNGTLKVVQIGGASIMVRLDPLSSGAIHGSEIDSGKSALHANIHGHWLENVWIGGGSPVWTFPGLHTNAIVSKEKELKQELKEETNKAQKGEILQPYFEQPALTRLSSADQDAVAFLQLLRREIPQLGVPEKSARFTDQYLFRFAKARGFNLTRTKEMLIAHIDWLEENKVDTLLQSFEYTELPLVKAAFPHGYHGVDKNGRPIYISRLAKTNQDQMFQATNWERFIKFWIQSYEDLLWKKIPACVANGGRNPSPAAGLPESSSLTSLQTLTILDVKGVGTSQLSSKVREFISVTSKLSSDNYPEILGTMYIVNAPSMFPLLWNMVKTMLDAGTRAKIHVVNAKQTREKLLEVIDPSQLPFFLGGECKCGQGDNDDDDSDHGCLSSDKGPWRAVSL